MSKTSKQGFSVRRLSRLIAVQALYQHEASENDIDSIISQFTLR
jgi:transcription termination factor NusB